MQNNYLSQAPPILKLLPKQYSLRQSLHYKHWGYEITTLQAAEKQRGSKGNQKFCRPFKELKIRQESALIPRLLIHPTTHPL